MDIAPAARHPRRVMTLGERCDVDDVVAFIVERRGPVSTGELHRYLYFSQAWHLAWEGVPLFAAPLVAWASGPVVASVFDAHRGTYRLDEWPHGDARRVTGAAADTVAEIVDSYGCLDPNTLHTMARADRTWTEARAGLGPADRGGRVIDLDDLLDLYVGLDNDASATPIAEIAARAAAT